jgi:hypothetical protein
MTTIEANVKTLRASITRLLKVKDGTLTSSTRQKLQDALRSLDSGNKGLEAVQTALKSATKAMDASVSDNSGKSGPYTGKPVGSPTPGAGVGLIPDKSLFSDDGAGARSRHVPASVRQAQRALELLRLRS